MVSDILPMVWILKLDDCINLFTKKNHFYVNTNRLYIIRKFNENVLVQVLCRCLHQHKTFEMYYEKTRKMRCVFVWMCNAFSELYFHPKKIFIRPYNCNRKVGYRWLISIDKSKCIIIPGGIIKSTLTGGWFKLN